MQKYKKALSAVLAIITIIGMAGTVLAANFSDTKGHWAEAYVDKANNNGLVKGVGNGRFNPDATVSAAEWATMVVNLFYPAERDVNSQLHKAGTATYGWWYSNMVTAADKALLDGTAVMQGAAKSQGTWVFGTGSSAPSVAMTRYDMAQVIYNVAVAQGWDISVGSYAPQLPDDARIPAGYRSAVNYCYYRGFITGVDAYGTFAGTDSMTRGAAATVLCRLFDVKQAGPIVVPEPIIAPVVSPIVEPVVQPIAGVMALNGVAINASLAEVNALLGAPKATYDYDNGTAAIRVYHDGGYKAFFLVGYQGEKVMYVYSVGRSHVIEGESSTVRKTEYTDSKDSGKIYAASITENGFAVQCSNYQSSEMLVFEITNAFRVLHGVSALSWDNSLGKAAHDHTQNMYDYKTLTHDGLGASEGMRFWERAEAAGYTGFASGENCSVGHYVPWGFVNSWINSEGHRNNMLKDAHRHMGVGVVGNYSTQMFGQ